MIPLKSKFRDEYDFTWYGLYGRYPSQPTLHQVRNYMDRVELVMIRSRGCIRIEAVLDVLSGP
jgi:hypothetical protein